MNKLISFYFYSLLLYYNYIYVVAKKTKKRKKNNKKVSPANWNGGNEKKLKKNVTSCQPVTD